MSDSSTQANCPRGHGPLENLVDSFAIPYAHGVAAQPGKSAKVSPDGRTMAVKMRRCASCGYVELFAPAA